MTGAYDAGYQAGYHKAAGRRTPGLPRCFGGSDFDWDPEFDVEEDDDLEEDELLQEALDFEDEDLEEEDRLSEDSLVPGLPWDGPLSARPPNEGR